EFIETFDSSVGTAWIFDGGGTVTYPASGIDGGNVLRVAGSKALYSTQILIPFDPRKLYRLRARARLMLTSNTAKTKLYIGVKCLDKNKADIGTIYFTLKGRDTYPNWLPANVWHELTGFFQGTGAPTTYIQPAPNPQKPSALPVGTTWISPYLAINYPIEAPIDNIVEVDDYRIESPDVNDG